VDVVEPVSLGDTRGLLAGAAEVDITPPPGIPKAGYSRNAHTGSGFRTRLRARHWLAKAERQGRTVDLVFGLGSWLAPIDRPWLTRGPLSRLFGVPVRLAPIEELIWANAFVAHRERYDGAEVLRLVWAGGPAIDWGHLVNRFADHWEVLAALVVLFRHVYPADADRIPPGVQADLLARLRGRWREAPAPRPTCRGPLLDRYQYLHDVLVDGLDDPREELAEARGFPRRLVEQDRRAALRLLRAGRVRPGADTCPGPEG
jgi:hypothetical protein